MVPLMELPTGDLISESADIAQYAIEKNAGKGIELVPTDPLVAKKMRQRMETFKKLLSSHGSLMDAQGIKCFNETTIPEFEKMCKDADGKWLMGTDDITQLDIWVGAIFEFYYLAD